MLQSVVEFFRSNNRAGGRPSGLVHHWFHRTGDLRSEIHSPVDSQRIQKTLLCAGCFLVHIAGWQRDFTGLLNPPQRPHLYAGSFA